jgi:hypothetical protein
LLATFGVQPANTTFAELLDCADNIADFVRSLDNWGNPLLPQPPGCPALETDSEEFTDEGKKWICA